MTTATAIFVVHDVGWTFRETLALGAAATSEDECYVKIGDPKEGTAGELF